MKERYRGKSSERNNEGNYEIRNNEKSEDLYDKAIIVGTLKLLKLIGLGMYGNQKD